MSLSFLRRSEDFRYHNNSTTECSILDCFLKCVCLCVVCVCSIKCVMLYYGMEHIRIFLVEIHVILSVDELVIIYVLLLAAYV